MEIAPSASVSIRSFQRYVRARSFYLRSSCGTANPALIPSTAINGSLPHPSTVIFSFPLQQQLYNALNNNARVLIINQNMYFVLVFSVSAGAVNNLSFVKNGCLPNIAV